ncbi:MAG TPA: PIN domain-containing protein [Pyrinomonadaceae bacterium]|nr:PIN domain-containing protein [Pyrinomonadaceae bacterium]
MSYLLDTNVLLRSVQKSHPMESEAANSIKLLLRQREILVITPQNLIEFWCVATRPEVNNGLGISINETVRRIESFKSVLVLLPDTDSIFSEWEQLVVRYRVSGKQVYDARRSAAMNTHRITHLLTFNTDDFKRYDGITVVNPSSAN